MQGAGSLYSAYSLRFGRRGTTFDQAVQNSKVLFETAAKAGVGRTVHLSVANASTESRLPYFRDKGQVEEMLMDMGIPYTIIWPTLVFGEGDLLLNNMAWALRNLLTAQLVQRPGPIAGVVAPIPFTALVIFSAHGDQRRLGLPAYCLTGVKTATVLQTWLLV